MLKSRSSSARFLYEMNRSPADEMAAAYFRESPARVADTDALEQLLRASWRGKKGDCPFCGTRLFKVGVFGTLTPLNEKGTVAEGTCLKCFQQNLQSGDVMRLSEILPPQVLAVDKQASDNATIISGVTLDSLLMSEERSEGNEFARRSPVRMRKTAKAGANSFANVSAPPLATSDMSLAPQYSRSMNFAPQNARSNMSLASSDVEDANLLASTLMDVVSLKGGESFAEGESFKGGGSFTGGESALYSLFDDFDDVDFVLSHYADAETISMRSMSVEGVPSISEISDLVSQLNQEIHDKLICISALRALSSAVWAHGTEAEIEFARARGMEALTTVMWNDITDYVVQEASINLLVALASPREGKAVRATLIGRGADGCVDALLITMQTLIGNEMIQESGCAVLCFLASTCVVDPNVNDGTASGAVLTVLGAMEAHPQSLRVQEWGVRALYQQSVFSKNADGNKQTIVTCKLASGVSGLAVIRKAFSLVSTSPVLTDRLCKLYWCLSANPVVAEMMSPISETLADLLSVARDVRKKPENAHTLEAALGAVANFTKSKANRSIINADATIALALDAMRYQMENVGALTEACSLISNLVFGAKNVDTLVTSGAVDVIINAMMSAEDDPSLVEEGMRALVGLCEQSVSSKDAVAKPAAASTILRLQDKYKGSLLFQHLYCLLLSSMCQSKNLRFPQIGDILRSMSSVVLLHLDSDRVQDSLCSALRMLSQKEDGRNAIRSSDIVSLIVSIMNQHRTSRAIQLNACCVLWNVTSKSQTSQALLDSRCVAALVQAIQTHLECTAIVEVACNALWSLVYGSDDMKLQMVKTEGGIDALNCVLLLHQAIPVVLESAVGVLSSLSSSNDLAKTVVSTESIGAVMEVLRNSGSNIRLLHFSLLFLKNSVVAMPDQVSTVKEAIPIVLRALKSDECSDSHFQMCACAFLHAVSSTSSDCRSLIISQNGIGILIRLIETSNVPGVRNAAVGAFNRLV